MSSSSDSSDKCGLGLSIFDILVVHCTVSFGEFDCFHAFYNIWKGGGFADGGRGREAGDGGLYCIVCFLSSFTGETGEGALYCIVCSSISFEPFEILLSLMNNMISFLPHY